MLIIKGLLRFVQHWESLVTDYLEFKFEHTQNADVKHKPCYLSNMIPKQLLLSIRMLTSTSGAAVAVVILHINTNVLLSKTMFIKCRTTLSFTVSFSNTFTLTFSNHI